MADILHIPTLEGWRYPAAIFDLFGRRIVGCAMSNRMASALARRVLRMAMHRCGPEPGRFYHSNQGSEYTVEEYQALPEAHHMLCPT